MMRYYGNPWEREADFPFNFDLIWVGRDGFVNVTDLEEKIHNWMFQMPEEKVLYNLKFYIKTFILNIKNIYSSISYILYSILNTALIIHIICNI